MTAPSTVRLQEIASPPATVPEAPSLLDESRAARHWLEDQLRLWGGTPRTLLVSIPAPVVEPEALLESSSRSMGMLWHPADGLAVAGVGVAHQIQLRGPERFASLRQKSAAILECLDTRHFEDCLEVPARLYGGLAFDVGAARDEPWQEFGDGGFSLPRMTYATDGQRASLALAVRGDEIADTESRLTWIAEVDALRSLLADRARRERSSENSNLASWRSEDAQVIAVQRPSQARWSQEIEAIRAEIAAGRHQKIVAAGHSRVELSSGLETAAVLRRLSRGLRSSTRFAFCRPRSTFLGATPERLITRRGMAIATEALAGSIAPGGEGAERLLHSGKDLREHQLVVDQIVRRLEPVCEQLDVDDPPRVRALRDVLHLLTPIVGRLGAPHHVLELVERLHPTPAVGGVPTESAMRWIRDHESSGRGWYAAPVGWFDADGEGDFAVALRSCVLRDREAFLFAGAGIVRDSDPDLEYRETELKKQALLTALGA